MIKIKFWLATLVFCVSSSVAAGELELSFDKFDEFTDVKRGNIQTQTRFENTIKKQFEKKLTKLASRLPAEQSLVVRIGNIDLAGWIDPRSGVNRLRVIKQQYPAKIDLTYQLKAGSKVLKQGNANLSDKGFLPTHRVGSSRAFYYEFELLEDWFKKTFS